MLNTPFLSTFIYLKNSVLQPLLFYPYNLKLIGSQ